MSKAARNDPCPCGSGKKYKKCCFLREQEKLKKRRGGGVFKPFSGGAPAQTLAKKVFKVLSTPMGEQSEASAEGQKSYKSLEELIGLGDLK